ncbi:hypothetical protein [Microlunatus flavus]|uniref:Uncharacterized protein n=1 Tax=Microlunatus flavus TaxID=1036181 RepID=A0A1H8ZN64_9ACTN|nr:hypothetical protein [Microlunatus flavus]SEP65673.1 hypothetical protein SAMN05421756_101300 [Microlunatus flavus]
MSSLATTRPPSTPVTQGRVPRALLVGVLAVTLVTNVAALVADVVRGTYLNVYSATQYYLTWQDGFFRRAFPGTVLHLLTGRDPSIAGLTVVITVVTVLGLVATAVLVALAARLDAFRGVEALALTVLVTSPLTFSMVLHNRSRLDSVVVLLFLLLALLPSRVLGARWLSSVLAAGLAAAAVGSLELSVGFVGAILLARALREPAGPARVVRLVAEVAPGAAIALASLLLRPSAASVDRVAGRFASVGIAAPHENSVSVLTNDLPQALALNRDHLLATRVLWFLVFLACFVVTVHLLRRLADRTAGAGPRRAETVFAALVLVTAGAVSVVGFDYGRWFSLALLALLASSVVLRGRPTTPLRVPTQDRPLPRTTNRLLVAVLLVSLLGQHFPVYPAWG